jgi:hypothetical protein
MSHEWFGRKCLIAARGQAVLYVLGERRDPRPHHVTSDSADKYKGKFDDGWDAYRGRVFKRAKEKG